MLDVRSLSHRYGDRWAIRNVQLQVAKGEILAVMGSSGGGKTTLLKCVAGLLVPTEGDVHIDGVSVRDRPDQARREMGFVFQYAALIDYLNVEDNVLFGLRRQRRVGKDEGKKIVADLLEELGLGEVQGLLPGELSGGMRKRVGLARALAMEPKVLLYDEPTSGLDPVTAYAIDRAIVDTRDRHDSTSVVVSHDVTSVFRVADRVAFLDGGEVVFHGSPEEFRRASEGPIRELVDKAHAERFEAELQA